MRPDLFILDISLPGMNGWDLARTLRDSGQADAAILMMSANIGDAQLGGDEGNAYDDTLPKPFDVRQLFDRLQTLLQLEWIDEPVRPAPNALARATVTPQPRRLDELLHLTRIGYIRGIEAKLAELEAEEPETAAFVDEMRVHVRAFDIPRLLARLEAISADEPLP